VGQHTTADIHLNKPGLYGWYEPGFIFFGANSYAHFKLLFINSFFHPA